jgi:AmmeMemoRadiSam system protein A
MHGAPDLGTALLAHARAAIGDVLGAVVTAPAAHAALALPGASFVTLHDDGRLRGCIGSVEAWRLLGADVRANAVAAAFHDPRFVPLARDEFAAITIEVSVLGRSERLPMGDEDETLARLRPEVDGVILECGSRRATFLPKVWEQLPDPREFLAALKHKAGLPADFWSADLTISRYSVVRFDETATAAAGAMS